MGIFDMTELRVSPHPLKSQNHKFNVYGRTLAEMLESVKVETNLPTDIRVFVNDLLIPEDLWSMYAPEKHDVISVKVAPKGGGDGKNPLRTILTIVVVAVAMWATAGGASSYLGAGFGAGTMGAALLGVGISYLGMMLVDAIAPLPSPAETATGAQADADGQSFGFEGARNRFMPYGPIPVVLGRSRFAPPYAAQPYTEIVGNDQFLRLLFCAGYGKVEISEMRIGETGLETFLGEGVPEDRLEVYIHQDFDPATDKLKIYPTDVKEEALNIALKESEGWYTRTTEPDVNQISVDVLAGKGMIRYDSLTGLKFSQQVEYEIQYAPTGTSNWSAGTTGIPFPLRTYTAPAPVAVLNNTCSEDDAQAGEGNCEDYYSGGVFYKIGLHKETGEIIVVTHHNQIWNLLPGYAAPICQFKTAVDRNTGADLGVQNLVDLRNGELNSSAPGDFAPSVNSVPLRKIDIAAGTIYSRHLIYGKTTTLLRDNVIFEVPKGQYDVRIRRLTADATDNGTFNEITWAIMRSIDLDTPPVNEAGYTLVEMRIKATDQLNGVVDTFNCVATTLMPAWNQGTSTWDDDSETNNPAALARYILQGSPNQRAIADSRLDLDSFEELSEYCTLKGITYNRVMDFQMSVWEVLREILGTARSSISYLDGKYGISVDKEQTIPAQVFSPRNSWGFSYEKRFYKIPHAFRVRFPNEEKDFRSDERIVYASGYDESTATEIEELQMPGTTSPSQALRNAYFHLEQITLRPEVYKWNCDFENLICTRGDMVYLNHDVLIVGLGSGRIKSLTDDGVNITAITFDETFTFEINTKYGITIRKDDVTAFSGEVTGTGETTTVALVDPVPLASGLAVGDLGLFGEFGSEQIKVLVTRIESSADLKSTINGVPYSDALYDDLTGLTPFQSKVNIPAGLYSPAVADIRSDESVQEFGVTGEYVPRMVIDFVTGATVDTDKVQQIEAQYKNVESGDWVSLPMLDRGANQVTIMDGLQELDTYDLRFRYHYTDDQSGPWSTFQHQVVGSTSNPSDVENFSMNILNGVAYFSWDAVTDRDLSHYELRYSAETVGPAWAASSIVTERISRFQTNISLPLRSGSYLIKAVDFGGRKSTNATTITASAVELVGVNVVETVQEDPVFSGTHDDTVRMGDRLELVNSDLMSSYALMSDIVSFRMDGNFVSEGTYTFLNSIDLGDVFTSRVTAQVKAEGVNYDETMGKWTLMSLIELMSNSVTGHWSIEVQTRTTDDDPSGAPTWSSWGSLVIGDYEARAFQFRIILRTSENVITPSVEELRVTVDMPDRVEGDQDIISDVSGTAIVFDPAFIAQPAIAVTGDNLGTGDYAEITSKSETGFTVIFKSSGGSGVARQFDWIAKGYGRVAS